ncbi:MAG: hypothetical protein IJU65_01950 [Desulfovibrio sp.]|nr:hypothetical protein [Desulfovibrio sp.]
MNANDIMTLGRGRHLTDVTDFIFVDALGSQAIGEGVDTNIWYVHTSAGVVDSMSVKLVGTLDGTGIPAGSFWGAEHSFDSAEG